MTTTYAAHIITADAHNMGDPGITIMTKANEDSTGDPIASYPLADGQDPIEVLEENGWRASLNTSAIEVGYEIADVEADDVEQIVRHVTFTKAQADHQANVQETAWRTIIRASMHDGASATKLAKAADISRERIYQIRDDRR